MFLRGVLEATGESRRTTVARPTFYDFCHEVSYDAEGVPIMPNRPVPLDFSRAPSHRNRFYVTSHSFVSASCIKQYIKQVISCLRAGGIVIPLLRLQDSQWTGTDSI
jgi:hypothetical protein